MILHSCDTNKCNEKGWETVEIENILFLEKQIYGDSNLVINLYGAPDTILKGRNLTLALVYEFTDFSIVFHKQNDLFTGSVGFKKPVDNILLINHNEFNVKEFALENIRDMFPCSYLTARNSFEYNIPAIELCTNLPGIIIRFHFENDTLILVETSTQPLPCTILNQ